METQRTLQVVHGKVELNRQLRETRRARQLVAKCELKGKVTSLGTEIEKLKADLTSWRSWYEGHAQQEGICFLPVPRCIAGRVRAAADSIKVHYDQSMQAKKDFSNARMADMVCTGGLYRSVHERGNLARHAGMCTVKDFNETDQAVLRRMQRGPRKDTNVETAGVEADPKTTSPQKRKLEGPMEACSPRLLRKGPIAMVNWV